MVVVCPLHKYLTLPTKDIELHRMQNPAHTDEHCQKSQNPSNPREVQTNHESRDRSQQQPSWPITIDRLDVLQWRLSLARRSVTSRTQQLAVIPTRAIRTLKDRFVKS
jgi:hypothetical protein